MQIQREAVGWASRALFVALWLAAVASQAAEPVVWPTQGWQTSSPEAQGMASAALAELVDFGAANDMDSMLVVRHGRVVLDATYAPFRPGMKHTVNSVTKARGRHAGRHRVQRRQARAARRAGARLLSGAQRRQRRCAQEGDDDRTPARQHLRPELARAAVERATGDHAADGAQRRLDRFCARPADGTSARRLVQLRQRRLAPAVGHRRPADRQRCARLREAEAVRALGHHRRHLASRSAGHPHRRLWPVLQPRDMAKIGYLYLRGGEWAGQQLLPPVGAQVLQSRVDMRIGPFRYANGWWTLPASAPTWPWDFCAS